MENDSFQDEAGRKTRHSARRPVMIGIVLVIAVYLLFDQVFIIKHLEIRSIKNIPAEEVARAAGFDKRASYFFINEHKIKEGINSNRYLVYEGMEKQFPDKITLFIREREQCVNLMNMGFQYLLDNEGMVLERMTIISLDNRLITLTGMQIRDIQVGSTIVCQQSAQMDAYSSLMSELSLQQFSEQISEINLSDINSIYLVSVDGFTINVGNSNEMRAKIGTVRAVLDKLREMGKNDGIIEASAPGVATYRPNGI